MPAATMPISSSAVTRLSGFSTVPPPLHDQPKIATIPKSWRSRCERRPRQRVEHMPRDKFVSFWAGAMGQTQSCRRTSRTTPSTFPGTANATSGRTCPTPSARPEITSARKDGSSAYPGDSRSQSRKASITARAARHSRNGRGSGSSGPMAKPIHRLETGFCSSRPARPGPASSSPKTITCCVSTTIPTPTRSRSATC